MNRKEFFRSSLAASACAGCFLLPVTSSLATGSTSPEDEKYNQLLKEKEFIQNWLTDLLNTIDENLDEPSKSFLLAGCGRGCFNRHQFKKDIAEKGKGDLDKLIEAYKNNFEVWKEGNTILYISGMEKSRRDVIVRRPNFARQNLTICIANAPAPPIKPFSKLHWADQLM